MPVAVVVVTLALILLSMSLRILKEYERAVVFRLGRVLSRPKGPGVIFLIPVIDRMRRVSLQVTTIDIPAQDVITRDNVTLRVNAVCYFRVDEATRATVAIQDRRFATEQIAQTTLRAVLCEVELDQVLGERDRLNAKIHHIVEQVTDPWGIKVTNVEIRDVELPAEMQRALARQAQAERERRAKILRAEGEHQAAERLADAAAVLEGQPLAFQLRFLQAMTQVALRNNRSVVLPLPVEALGFASRASAAFSRRAAAAASLPASEDGRS